MFDKRRAYSSAVLSAAILVVVTECGIAQSVLADYDHKTQKLIVPVLCEETEGLELITDSSCSPATINFERTPFTVVEAEPWIHPEKMHTQLSRSELIEVLTSVGFYGHGLEMALAIIQLESTNKIYAHNQNSETGDNSYGLFQINMIGSMGPARLEKYGLESNEDLFNPEVNARVAYEISGGGKSWGAWTTYEKAKSLLG
jgi:hypothetical protein